MINITLIGTGNVALQLKEVFEKTDGIQVNRIISGRGDFISKIKLKKAKSDIYIIAISDDAISSVSQKLKDSEKLIVHTSGSVSMNALPEGNRRGVFYPLQTFSKNRKIDFQSVPICIETEDKNDLVLLEKLARLVSSSVYEINSEQRKSLHLAAVFVNNFTNHMYHIGNELCDTENIPFEILKPLITETALKVNSLTPFDAQTGPARREDKKTIAKQIAQLAVSNHKKIYQAITNSILNAHGKEL